MIGFILPFIAPVLRRIIPLIAGRIPSVGAISLLSIVAVGVLWFGGSRMVAKVSEPPKVSVEAIKADRLQKENAALRDAQQQYIKVIQDRSDSLSRQENAYRLLESEYARLRDETPTSGDPALPWDDPWLRKHSTATPQRNN